MPLPSRKEPLFSLLLRLSLCLPGSRPEGGTGGALMVWPGDLGVFIFYLVVNKQVHSTLLVQSTKPNLGRGPSYTAWHSRGVISAESGPCCVYGFQTLFPVCPSICADFLR